MFLTPIIRRTSIAAVLCTISLLSACAATPQRPSSALQSAERAIATAEDARAVQHAPLELRQARDKLAAANNAVEKDEMDIARRLAEEAAVLAELALARSEMQVALETNKELKNTTDMYKDELTRKKVLNRRAGESS